VKRSTVRTAIAISIFLLSLTVGPGAQAHSVHLGVSRSDDGSLTGSVQGADGRGIAGAAVLVSTRTEEESSRKVLQRLTTNADGEFRYIPTEPGDLHFLAATPDGHGASATFRLQSLGASNPPDSAAVARLAEEVSRLTAEVQTMRQTTRLRDILGGVGYLVGIAGIAAYLSARKRRKGTQR